MDEFSVIKTYFQKKITNAKLGIGDDCALISSQDNIAITTDTLVEGIHFFSNVDPYKLGYKCLAVNISDLAAMGAEPKYFTLALTMPRVDENFLLNFSRGLFDLASNFNMELIGGDTTRGNLKVFTITAFGEIPNQKEISRSQAQINDDIYVTGNIGAASFGVDIIKNSLNNIELSSRIECFERLELPLPRVNIGLKLRNIANSMLDLSDGLISDLPHILELSNCGASIYVESLPINKCLKQLSLDQQLKYALAGGDDYELCFTAPTNQQDAIKKISKDCNVAITKIGKITHEKKLLFFYNGQPLDLKLNGYNHFHIN